MIAVTVCIAFSALLVSCYDEAGAFGDTDSINIKTPEDESTVGGDIMFSYSEHDATYVNIAIFKDIISIDSDNQILNRDDCVGGIRTNMRYYVRGENYLRYMKPYSTEDNDYTGDGTLELTDGATYYWMIWGLNDTLTEVIESSPIYSFTYTTEDEQIKE